MKERIITRTVNSLSVTVIGFDESDNVKTLSVEIPCMDDKKILPYITASVPGFTPAKIKSMETIEQLYGMPESVFMRYAEKLPPRKNYDNKEQG